MAALSPLKKFTLIFLATALLIGPLPPAAAAAQPTPLPLPLAVSQAAPISAKAVPMALASSASFLSAGSYHTCAVVAGGVKCWGDNYKGQLGDGSYYQHNAPVDVVGIGGTVDKVSAGGYHTCALLTTGRVQCWGSNARGQLGNGETSLSTTPVDVLELENVIALAAGGSHTCALTGSGGLYCWGDNTYGQLGNGTEDNYSSQPVQVYNLGSGVSSVSAGSLHTCAVTQSHGLLCWGWNEYGQLGDGTYNNHMTPFYVAGLLSGATSVLASNAFSCALTEGDGVKCWGWNEYGQLGDGSGGVNHPAPADVYGLNSGVSHISQGNGLHACALLSAGGVQCWGLGVDGELGNNLNQSSDKPVSVIGLATPLVSIVTGVQHTCVLDQNGGVWCWGLNLLGAVGDGTATDRSMPVQVKGLESKPYDLGVDYVELDPYSPRAMSDATIVYRVSNQGEGTYIPLTGEYAVEIQLTDTGPGPDQVKTYRFSGSGLEALDPGEFTLLEISDFWFTRQTISHIELQFIPTDADKNGANESASQDITIQTPESSILDCLSLVLDVIEFYLALHHVDASTLQDITVRFVLATTKVGEALMLNDSEAALEACIDFIVDAGKTIAIDKLEKLGIIDVATRLILIFFDSVADAWDCGTAIADAFLRLTDGFNAAGAGLNTAYVESPIFVLVENESGNQVGFTDSGTAINQIDGAEALVSSEGHKLLLAPGRDLSQIKVYGAGTGTFRLSLALALPDGSTANVQYLDVPINDAAAGVIEVADPNLALAIDDNDDLIVDRTLEPDSKEIVWPGTAYLPAIRTTCASCSNQAPSQPASPSPTNDATGQATLLQLGWTGSDPDGDAVTYDVYLQAGNANPTPLRCSRVAANTCSSGTLNAGTTYSWKVVAYDEHGASTAGPTWNFTTAGSGFDPGAYVSIPAGTFQMGCDSRREICSAGEIPLHSVTLDAYQIGKYEVTNARYAACVAAGSCSTSASSSSHTRDSYYGNPTYEDYPVLYVSWSQAGEFCAWEGGRLPYEAEWEKAARGSGDTRIYPWGDDTPDCTRLNYHHDTGSSDYDCMGDTAQVGSYPTGASPYGVMDLLGNAIEWVYDWYDENYYSVSPSSNPHGPVTGSYWDGNAYRGVRGGAFNQSYGDNRAASRTYYNHAPWYIEGWQRGFRCVKP